MDNKKLMEDLLTVLPYWHYKIDKTIKQTLKSEMSLETYYCLQTLRREGPMTMTELAARLKITKQQATKLAGKLYEHQFLERIPDKNDRRCIRVQISEAARNYMAQERAQNDIYIERLEEQLKPEDIEKFESALEILLEVLPKLE